MYLCNCNISLNKFDVGLSLTNVSMVADIEEEIRTFEKKEQKIFWNNRFYQAVSLKDISPSLSLSYTPTLFLSLTLLGVLSFR